MTTDFDNPFARPLAGPADRVAAWLARRIGIVPRQVVADAGRGPERPGDRPQVVVAGGGLAGMSAAIRLAERGFAVTLVERETHLGGKLGAWPTTLPDGEPAVVEHGFHGFFLQYYNLAALFRDGGVDLADFPLVDDYRIADARGRVEDLRDYPRAPPLSVLAMAMRSPFLNLREARRMRGSTVWRDAFLGYDPARTAARFDGVSFATLLEQMGLAGTGFETVFKVFGHSFFADAAHVSAAEIVKNFHFFFFANPESLLFRYCRTDFAAAVWTPLRRHLERHGGSVRLGCAVDAVAPRTGGGFRITLAGRSSDAESLDADAVVLALDPPGLAAVLARSSGLGLAGSALSAAVPPAQPYAVLRVWGARDCAASRPQFTSLHGFAPLDSVSLYHRMQDASRAWAARHGGGVYELHAYTPSPREADDPERLEAAMLAAFTRALPELAGMPIVHRVRQVRRDFPGFPPGSSASRLTTTTGVPGLVLAGDHIRLEVPAALMEAAVTSGIAAANALLAERGLGPLPIWSVPPRSVLLRSAA